MAILERGFKSWCERTALAVRAELAIETHGPLCPRQLAAHLGVELITPTDVPKLPAATLRQLTEENPEGWSAVSFTVSGATTIVYNANNSPGRQASDIMHEISHFMLNHEPSQVILSIDGQLAMRSFDGKQEDEANWFGWTMLLPRTALVHCAHLRMNSAEIARTYGVSGKLVEFRQRMTGVLAQLRRTRKVRH